MKGAVPPATLAEIVELHALLHTTLDALTATVNGFGCVTVTVEERVQPFASVTVSVYDPAQSPLIEEEVCPPGSHK